MDKLGAARMPALKIGRVAGVPVAWLSPDRRTEGRPLVLFLPSLGGSKLQMADAMRDAAAAGHVALSFDPPGQGERASEAPQALFKRVFGAFRREMWPLLGQTTLEALQLLDWAVRTLGVQPGVRLAGLSMGGDAAVAAAGLDRRIERVVAVVATPDWLRPGMHDVLDPGRLVDQGDASPAGQALYDALDPLTHLSRYQRRLDLHFICGGEDSHVPANGAERFRAALAARRGAASVTVEIVPGLRHLDTRDPGRWWPQCRRALLGPGAGGGSATG